MNSLGSAKPTRRRSRRWAIVAGLVLGIAVVVLLILAGAIYAERRQIVASFVQRYLAAYGVESEIDFDRLAWGGFLARVRAGPVDAPDFTAEAVDVTLIYQDTSSLAARVTPQVAAVRLVRPVLRISYDGEKLSFGSLQQLIDDVFAMDSDVPGPEIEIEDGRILLATPYGQVQLLADAAIDKGSVTRLEGTIERTSLKHESLTAEVAGGTISAAMVGDVVNGKFSLSLSSLTRDGGTAHSVEFGAESRELKWKREGASYEFVIPDMVLTLAAATAQSPEFSAGPAAARLAVRSLEGSYRDGELRFGGGRTTVSGEIARLNIGDAFFANVKTESALTSFADISSTQWSADTAGHIVLDATDARYPVSGGTVALASMRTEFDSVVRRSPSENTATFKGTLAGNGSLPDGIALRSLRADFDGETRDGNHRLLLSSVTAGVSMPPARALALASEIPAIGTDDAISRSIASAFQTASIRLRNFAVMTSGDGYTVTANAPVEFEGVQKASLTLSPRRGTALARSEGDVTTGGLDLDLRGGGLPALRLAISSYRYQSEQDRAQLEADAEFATALTYGTFRGIDLSASGNLQMVGDRVRLDVPECADLSMASYTRRGADLVRNVKGRLCGAAVQVAGDRVDVTLATCADVSFEAFINDRTEQVREAKGQLCAVPNRPVFVSQPGGWQVEARINEAGARLVAAQAGVTNGSARVELSGDSVAIRSGTIALDRATFSDLEPVPRFRQVSASGAMRVMGDNWAGDLTVSLGQRRLASVALKHAADSGMGEAAISARELSFAPNVLQPADISPSLAAFGSQIRGTADFSARLSWSNAGTTSEGRLVIPGIDLQSPFGAMRQVKTELTFTSLFPVALRERQAITAERLDVLVPLEQVSATFTYTLEAVRIESASAAVAQGQATLDPMTYNLVPGAASQGTIRLQNIALAQLLEVAGLTDRIMADARIDGVLPFTLGPNGARFANGRVAATAPGRVSIKREALTGAVATGEAQAPPNAVQDFAYQALENLAFERLEGTVNSQPMGRLGVQLHIVGSNDPQQAAEPRVGVLDLLRGRAFDQPLPLPKGTPIDLTLDTSVNLDELLESYLNRRGGAGAPAMPGPVQ